MTKEELWAIYVRKNPGINNIEVAMTRNGFRRFFDTTWDQAHDAGFANGKAWAEMEADGNPVYPSDIFKEMFGGKKT